MSKDKYWLPDDYARCLNKDCELKKKCKRSIEHYKGSKIMLSCISATPKNGECEWQLKVK